MNKGPYISNLYPLGDLELDSFNDVVFTWMVFPAQGKECNFCYCIKENIIH